MKNENCTTMKKDASIMPTFQESGHCPVLKKENTCILFDIVENYYCSAAWACDNLWRVSVAKNYSKETEKRAVISLNCSIPYINAVKLYKAVFLRNDPNFAISNVSR